LIVSVKFTTKISPR
jgi:hypothetical protein